MIVGNLYTINATYGFDDESDIFILVRMNLKPPEKGVNQKWIPIGYFRNLATGDQVKINHPESVFVPVNRLDSNDIAETL